MSRERKKLTRSQLAGAAGAASVIPATLLYVKYGRMPSKRLAKIVRERLMGQKARKTIKRLLK